MNADPPFAKAQLALAKVLVVGDAMLDRYWFGDVDRISPEAPVPIVRVTREEYRLGGAANVALNIQSLGAQSTLLTVVGTDEPATILEDLLAQKGVSTLFRRDSSLSTTVKLRVSGRSQQLLRIDFENKPSHEALASMLQAYETALSSHDAVLFSDYGKGGLTHVSQMISLALEAGKPVLVDPKTSDFDRYRGATVVTPNRAELAQVVGDWHGEADLLDRAHALRNRLELMALVVTRSEEGISIFDAEGDLHFAAQAREVFDVTGAGDTVIATLAAFLAAGASLRTATPIANRAGGLVVRKFGTASVTFEELFECE